MLDDLRRVTHFARMKQKLFAEHINRRNSTELRWELNGLQKELDGMRKRRDELNRLFKRLYEDHVLGHITSEHFRLLSADYNDEQKTLDEAIPEKEARMDKLKASVANVDAFIEKAKHYRSIDKLTPELVRLFIARIEIGEREVKYSRNSVQKMFFKTKGAVIVSDAAAWGCIFAYYLSLKPLSQKLSFQNRKLYL